MAWFSRKDKGSTSGGDGGGSRAVGATAGGGEPEGPEFDPSVPLRARVSEIGEPERARVEAGLARLAELGVRRRRRRLPGFGIRRRADAVAGRPRPQARGRRAGARAVGHRARGAPRAPHRPQLVARPATPSAPTWPWPTARTTSSSCPPTWSRCAGWAATPAGSPGSSRTSWGCVLSGPATRAESRLRRARPTAVAAPDRRRRHRIQSWREQGRAHGAGRGAARLLRARPRAVGGGGPGPQAHRPRRLRP